MLDIKFIRQHSDAVRKAIYLKKEKDCLDRILELDEQKRKNLAQVESLRALRNRENESRKA